MHIFVVHILIIKKNKNMDNKKTLTEAAVKLELDRLILANGQATTLEVKQQLQALDYFAKQETVHNFVEKIFAENDGKYNRQLTNGTYNVYTATSDWEQTVASKTATPVAAPSVADFESKIGVIEKNHTNPLHTNALSVDEVIGKVAQSTPMHKFHDQIRESSIVPGVKIVAEYDVRKGEMKTVNDLNKGTEHEVKDEQPVTATPAAAPVKLSTIALKIVEIIVDKLGLDETKVTMTASFTNDLGCDSLDAVELLMEFEREFDTANSDEAEEKMRTVGDVVAFIETAKTGTSASTAGLDPREPLKIFYTFSDFEKHKAYHTDYDPKNWVCHQRNTPNTEIHVYNKTVTRDQARSRFASKHKVKSGEVRCATAERFNLQEA